MASDTLPLDAPMLPPLVLRPPFGPRLLRGAVLVLAVILHVFTAGWGVIVDGREGEIAGTARLLMREPGWRVGVMEASAGPLPVWLAKSSMNGFGATEFGARLPTALAAVAAVWFTLRLGERLGGLWRGFAAGMLLLCCPGFFTLARMLTAAPLEMAFLTAAFYFLESGSRQRAARRQWYGFFWVAFALGILAGGWRVAVVPMGTVALLLLFYREARLRFRPLLSWEGVLLVALAVVGVVAGGAGGVLAEGGGVPPVRRMLWQGVLLFPWPLLLLPAAWSVAARLFRREPLDWAEALPLAWLGSALWAALFLPGGGLFETLWAWPAFALWAAYRLEITSRRLLLRALAAVAAVSAAGLFFCRRLPEALAWLAPGLRDPLAAIPPVLWGAAGSMAFLALLALVLFVLAAFILEWQRHRRYAVLALFGAMIPAGYALADTSARLAPYFSGADLAHALRDAHEGGHTLAIDGPPAAVSSLLFYLGPPWKLAALPAAPAAALEGARAAGCVVAPRSRLAFWQPLVAEGWRAASEPGGRLLLARPERATPPRALEKGIDR